MRWPIGLPITLEHWRCAGILGSISPVPPRIKVIKVPCLFCSSEFFVGWKARGQLENVPWIAFCCYPCQLCVAVSWKNSFNKLIFSIVDVLLCFWNGLFVLSTTVAFSFKSVTRKKCQQKSNCQYVFWITQASQWPRPSTGPWIRKTYRRAPQLIQFYLWARPEECRLAESRC